MSVVNSINEDLARAAIVGRVEFATDLTTGQCSMVLELWDDYRRPTERVIVRAEGVTGLSMQGWGGGITTLQALQAKDVSDLQHDRVRFVLRDLEDDALSLRCQNLSTMRVPKDA